jgi:F-type H+-transporting ATPase subunit epsilon
MADRDFTLDVVTPDRVVLSEEVTSVVAPGVQGAFGVLSNHAPLLSELSIGELRFRRPNGREIRLAVGGGFLQVFNNEVTVLADTAELAEEIDVERARRALEAARRIERDLSGDVDRTDREQAHQAAARALNRISVAGAPDRG